MTRTTRRCITALLALAGTVGLVGVSGALEGEDPVLEEVDCVEVPTDPSCDVPVDDTTPDDTTTTVPDDTTTTTPDDGTVDDGTVDDGALDDVVTPETGPVDNHGAAVSTAAHECPAGPEHGPCVREVAKSDAGKATETGDELDDEVEDEVEASAAKGGPPEGKGKPAR